MRTTLTGDGVVDLDLDALRRRFAAGGAFERVEGDPGTAAVHDTLVPAAVLVPIVLREAALTVLFTQRTGHLRAHSGQISFPGGRREPQDADAPATALRETEEEIGLARERIELLGTMPEYRTRTGFRITAVVGLVAPPFDLRPDANEVDEVFEVPLAFLLDPANHQRHSREWQGRQVSYYAMPWEGRYIWGATAAMLVNLYRRLAAAA